MPVTEIRAWDPEKSGFMLLLGDSCFSRACMCCHPGQLWSVGSLVGFCTTKYLGAAGSFLPLTTLLEVEPLKIESWLLRGSRVYPCIPPRRSETEHHSLCLTPEACRTNPELTSARSAFQPEVPFGFPGIRICSSFVSGVTVLINCG